MEGGEDAVNTISDSSWNLFKLSEINENFSETTQVTGQTEEPEVAPHVDHGHHHSDFYLKVRAALLIIAIMGIIYVVLRVLKCLRVYLESRRQRVDIPRLEISTPSRGLWRRRVRDIPSAPIISNAPTTPAAEHSPCPSYTTATSAPIILNRAIKLLEEVAMMQEQKRTRTMSVSPTPRPSSSCQQPADMDGGHARPQQCPSTFPSLHSPGES